MKNPGKQKPRSLSVGTGRPKFLFDTCLDVLSRLSGITSKITKSTTTVVPLMFFLGLLSLFAILSPDFLTFSNFENIIMSASVLLVVCLGGTFPVLMGCIDLSVGMIATVTGIICAILVPKLGLLVILVGIFFGTAWGLLNGILFVGLRIPSFLVTLGSLTVLHGIALYITNGYAVRISYMPYNWIANGHLIASFPNIGLWALIVFAIMIYVQFQTRLGLYTLAIGGAEKIVQQNGVPVGKYKVLAFGLSGLLSCLGGILLSSRLGCAEPAMGVYLMLDSLTAIVVGGTAITGGAGGVNRTILGILVVTILSNGMNIVSIHPYNQTIIRGFTVILTVALLLDRKRILQWK